jgi:hypothetical protein
MHLQLNFEQAFSSPEGRSTCSTTGAIILNCIGWMYEHHLLKGEIYTDSSISSFPFLFTKENGQGCSCQSHSQTDMLISQDVHCLTDK